jgi:Rrf2 family protein
MLTRRSKYGIKALQMLAEQAGAGPVLIADLAEEQQIPKKFLEAILLDLKNHGLLESRKGKGGGYLLRRDPRDITVGDVIRLLDGPLALVPCASQTAYAPCRECVDEATCSIRWVMKRVRDATAEILDQTTLAALNQHGRSRQDRRVRPKKH